MRRCKVCGKWFQLKKENKYEVVSSCGGTINALFEKPKTIECFDCPKCGCQNMVNIKESGRINEEVDDDNKA